MSLKRPVISETYMLRGNTSVTKSVCKKQVPKSVKHEGGSIPVGASFAALGQVRLANADETTALELFQQILNKKIDLGKDRGACRTLSTQAFYQRIVLGK